MIAALSRLYVRFSARVDIPFLLLCGALLLTNQLIMSPEHFVMNDTKVKFEAFHYFYSEMYYNHQLAHWLPYGTYGVHSSAQLAGTMTPAGYVTAIIGAILRVPDALLIFKITVLFEQFIFLLGMYLVSRLLFIRRTTILMVCIAAVCGTIWQNQIYFNFEIFYMLPLVLYFLLRFFQERKPEFVWIAGIVSVAWANGNAVYFPFLWIFVLTIFCSVMLWGEKRIWHDLTARTIPNIVMFILFVASATLFVCHTLHSFDHVNVTTLGRNELNGKSDLEDFLSVGGNATMTRVLQSVFFGQHLILSLSKVVSSETSTTLFSNNITLYNFTGNNTLYVGMLPLFFFAWAVLKVRDRKLIAFSAPAAALLMLSFGGFFARLFYYFPGMQFYRHIGLVFGVAKILVLLCAGMGMENFFSCHSPRRMYSVVFVVLFALVLLVIYHAGIDDVLRGIWQFYWGTTPQMPGASLRFLVNAAAVIVIILAGLLHTFSNNDASSSANGIKTHVFIKGLLVCTLFIDMMSFQISYIYMLDKPFRQFLDTVTVHKPEFYMQRTAIPPAGSRQERAIALSTNPHSTGLFSPIYSFAQFDPCKSIYHTNFASAEVNELVNVRFANRDTLKSLLGCYTPKIRLVENVKYFTTKNDERRAVSSLDNPYDIVFLRNNTLDKPWDKVSTIDDSTWFTDKPFFLHHIHTRDGNYQEYRYPDGYTINLDGSPVAPTSSRNTPFVQVTSFNSNEVVIEAQTVSANDAWLVYADAYHPGWHATVNGVSVKVYEAYLAFKAVHLQPGKNIIRFTFNDNLNLLVAFFNMAIGIGFIAGFVSILFQLLPAVSNTAYQTQ